MSGAEAKNDNVILQHFLCMNDREMDTFLNSENSDDSVEDFFKGPGRLFYLGLRLNVGV